MSACRARVLPSPSEIRGKNCPHRFDQSARTLSIARPAALDATQICAPPSRPFSFFSAHGLVRTPAKAGWPKGTKADERADADYRRRSCRKKAQESQKTGLGFCAFCAFLRPTDRQFHQSGFGRKIWAERFLRDATAGIFLPKIFLPMDWSAGDLARVALAERPAQRGGISCSIRIGVSPNSTYR